MNPSHIARFLALALTGGTMLLLAACATSTPVAIPAVASGGIDYAKPETWLCRPGRAGKTCAPSP